MATQTAVDIAQSLTVKELIRHAIERRAVEAVIWGMPAVNFELMYQAMVRAKGAFNQIVYWSRLPDWKNRTLTPNPDTIYLMPFFNTKGVGPVVIEIPAAEGGSITGTIMDSWQAALEDVGPAGVDKGKGGKYVILPPGFTGKIPDDCIPLPSDTNAGYALLRSNLAGGSDANVAKAVAYGKRIRIYPLSQESSLPETKFIDAADVVFDSTIPYDVRFFEALHRFVQDEPWLERDKAMIDQLKSLGLEKGKPFNPDGATEKILNDAAGEAHAWLESHYETSFRPSFYEGSRWALPISPEILKDQATFWEGMDAFPVDDRGLLFHYAFSSVKHLGTGQFYLFTIKDKAGADFDGGNTYRLTVPPNPPVERYWSATIYDRATHALIRDMPWSSRSSNTPGLQRNVDGSVDIFFGPEASAGKESNWVPTSASGEFEVLFRLYGPKKTLFDKTWKLPDVEKIAEMTGKKNGTAAESATSAQKAGAPEACKIARDAYVYAYPLILNYLTIRQAANYAEPTGIFAQGPFNQFGHANSFPPADIKTVVRLNVDTLYSVAPLDLKKEPLVLSVPAIDRFFMLQMLSLWTDVFAVPGSRTTGRNTARDFLLVGPGWRGEVPSGLELIRCPTRFVAIGGRTQTNGVADYENVHKIQAGYKLRPLSAWGKGDYVPPKGTVDPGIDMKTPPPVQVDKMDAVVFFGLFSELLKDNPPGPLDYPMIQRLERVGLKIGESFNLNAASPALKQAVERGAAEGKSLVARLGKKAQGEGAKDWVYTTTGGAFGANYRERAAVAYYALGMNLPDDAVYPSLSVDSDGKQLDGNNNYVLRFERAKLPPVDAFWSVTAYDTEGYLIPNALKRQAIGDRDKLVPNADGSIEIYIQAGSPGVAKEANWLPVSKAPFTLLMRLYSPRGEILDGTWTPPPVRKT